MTVDELLRKSEKKGYAAGYAEGEQRMNRLLKLVSQMIESGEADAVSRLSEDSDFLSQMFEKYHV